MCNFRTICPYKLLTNLHLCALTANIRLDEDVLKTSFVFVFRRRLDQEEFVRFSLTSSEDVFKTSSRRLSQEQYVRPGHTFSRRLQDVLPRCLQDVYKTSSRRLAKTSSRYLQDVLKTSWRYLQDVFKTYYQVKGFLVTELQEIFETYSKRFWDLTAKTII